MIDINTKFITLIGTPLSQSFAARMQNAAYEVLGANMRYFYTEAGTEQLEKIIDAVRYMPSFAGAAVTKPNKVAVLRYLDELDGLCEMIGACNTVVKLPDGRLRGYNTDAEGFIASLRQDGGVDPEGRTFFLIGAGGAGRAICWALAMNGAERIYIASRTEASREALAEAVNSRFPGRAQPTDTADGIAMERSDVIINASGVGMGATEGTSPVDGSLIPAGRLCYDCCYSPERTQFLMDAEEAGCRVLNGLGMSLYQGVRQIELWQDKIAPVEAMRRELTAILEEKKNGKD